jgi:hypothetical protein
MASFVHLRLMFSSNVSARLKRHLSQRASLVMSVPVWREVRWMILSSTDNTSADSFSLFVATQILETYSSDTFHSHLPALYTCV